MKTKYFLAIIMILFFAISAQGADVTLAWDANTEPDLAGYKIFWGESSDNMDQIFDVGNVTQYTITGLDDGTTYFIAAKAYDNSGNESGFSNILSYVASPPSIIIRIMDKVKGLKVLFD